VGAGEPAPSRREDLPSVDDHFSVYEPEDVSLSLDMSYEAMVQSLLPVQCADSKEAVDTDELLFKVAVVPVETDDDAAVTPIGSRVRLPGFALVVSMNHTVGDGQTYYSLYGMLGAGTEVEALDPIRAPGFEKAKTEVVGETESALLTSAGLGLGIVGTYLLSRLARREPQNVCVHTVDPAWIAREKAKAEEEAQIPYFPGDVETPALIRQSILRPDGGFRARRAGSPETRPPGFWTRLRNKTAIITNWASFHHEVVLEADAGLEGSQPQRPQLHLPVMRSEGMLTSVWNTGVVFRPRAGELGMLMITRRFDNDVLAHRKKEQGRLMPVGQRLI